MKYRLSNLSILSFSSILWFIYLLLDTIVYYDDLTSGEGWGMLAAIILMSFALAGVGIDIIIWLLIKRFKRQYLIRNILGIMVILLGVLLFR